MNRDDIIVQLEELRTELVETDAITDKQLEALDEVISAYYSIG